MPRHLHYIIDALCTRATQRRSSLQMLQIPTSSSYSRLFLTLCILLALFILDTVLSADATTTSWSAPTQRPTQPPPVTTTSVPFHKGAGALAMEMLTLVSPIIVVALFFLCLLRFIFRCCRYKISAMIKRRIERRTNPSGNSNNVDVANVTRARIRRHEHSAHMIADLEAGDDSLYSPNNFMIRTIRIHPSDYFFSPHGMPHLFSGYPNGFLDDSLLEEPFPPKYEDAIKLPAPSPRPSGSPARSSNTSRVSQLPRTVPPPPLYDQTTGEEEWETMPQQSTSSSLACARESERRLSCVPTVELRQERDEEPPAYSDNTLAAIATICDRVSSSSSSLCDPPLTTAPPKQMPEFVKKFTRGRLASVDSVFQDPRKSIVPSPMGSMAQLTNISGGRDEGRVQSTTSLSTTVETFVNQNEESLSEFDTPRATLGSHLSLSQSLSDSAANGTTQEARGQSRRVMTASLQTFVPKLGHRAQQQKQQLLRPRITLASMGTALSPCATQQLDRQLMVESVDDVERPQSSLSSLCPLDVPSKTTM